VRDFTTAVEEELEEGEEAETPTVTFQHDEREVTFYKPSTGQMALMMSMGGREMDLKTAGNFIALFLEMADDETQRYFQTRLLERPKPGQKVFDLASEGGIYDIFEALGEHWGGKKSKQPSDFQSPRRATGKRSTATTPVRARTSSRSRSADS
jgi:hypothetical protein